MKSLSTFVVPYEIASITDTQFMDVYPYFDEEEEQIPENLSPLGQVTVADDVCEDVVDVDTKEV